ncbi:MAG: hypothetical protein A2Y15_06205 [Clostridiales bacterium GWF2_36_10]|nr:MAG: hypothetical protein A2Y15_06205 [Clostridiales bacterium GWF2_36_10]HAN21891.1 hypothetical protein [Clostridiales bacterium]
MINGFLSRFMQGRYGTDKLNIFLSVILVILWIIDIFVTNTILYGIQLIVFALFLLRFLSRNTYKRRKENEKFVNIAAPITKLFKNKMRQLKDKDNKYFKCPKCSANLRVPKNRGSITVTCPVCKHKFDKKT